MRTQVVKMTNYGIWRVIKDDARKYNKFVITKNGKKVDAFADLPSCMQYLTEHIREAI